MLKIENGKFLIGLVTQYKEEQKPSKNNPNQNFDVYTVFVRLAKEMPMLEVEQKAADKIVKDHPAEAAKIAKTRVFSPGEEIEISMMKKPTVAPGDCVLIFNGQCEVQGWVSSEDGTLVLKPRVIVKLPSQIHPILDKQTQKPAKVYMSKMIANDASPPPVTLSAANYATMGGRVQVLPTDTFETVGKFKEDPLYRLTFSCTIGDCQAYVIAYDFEQEFGFPFKPILAKPGAKNAMHGIPSPAMVESWSAWMRLFVVGLNPVVEGQFNADETMAAVASGAPIATIQRARFSRPPTDAFGKIGVELDLVHAIAAIPLLDVNGPDPKDMKKCLIYVVTGQNEELEAALTMAKNARFFLMPKPTGVRTVLSTSEMGLTQLIARVSALPMEQRASALAAAVSDSDSYPPTLMLLVVRETPPTDPAAYAAMATSVHDCYGTAMGKRDRTPDDADSESKKGN